MGSRVFGEPVAVLLHELASHTGEAELVDEGMYGLQVSVPPDLGGALRRAILRATAVELRQAAEDVGDRFHRPNPHELEAAAVLRVARQVASAARESGLQGRSLQERALLLGSLSPVPTRPPSWPSVARKAAPEFRPPD